MDDLTKIKGIGKATAEKLGAAGFSTFAALALATTTDDLKLLQEAGFAQADIEKWSEAAKAELFTNASQADQAGPDAPPAHAASTDVLLSEVAKLRDHETVPVIPQGTEITFVSPLIAKQEVRHLGVTYGPGDTLPSTVEGGEAEYLKSIGAAENA